MSRRNPFGLFASEAPISDEFLKKLRPAIREQTGLDLDSTMLTRDDAFQTPDSPEHQLRRWPESDMATFEIPTPKVVDIAPDTDTAEQRRVIGQGQCEYKPEEFPG